MSWFMHMSERLLVLAVGYAIHLYRKAQLVQALRDRLQDCIPIGCKVLQFTDEIKMVPALQG